MACSSSYLTGSSCGGKGARGKGGKEQANTQSGRGRTSEARADRLEHPNETRGGGGGPTARAKDRARRSAHSLETCPLQHLYTHSAGVELQLALTPVVREGGEGFVTALGLFFLRRRVPGEDCDGARASRCDAMRRELKNIS